jgi:DNA processing protein
VSPDRFSTAAASVRPGQPGAWPERFATEEADREALLVLSHLGSLTPARLHALAWQEGSARRCLGAVRGGRLATGVDRAIADAVDPKEVWRRLDRAGGRMVVPGDRDYPLGLLDLPDPPGWLFARGGPLVGWPAAVAIVGARRCTPYGREVAGVLAGHLAAAGVVVVSGAARGIDAAAHQGALRAEGTSAAVLGSGIDVSYPRTNARLIDRLATAGAVVSEYPPGHPALPRRFPARNRIVAALSDAVVVVEGAEGSGSLITAEFAQDLGRDVMAVPGPVTGPLSAAPNGLIKDGCHLVASSDDVLDVLGLSRLAPARPGPMPESDDRMRDLGDDERRVLARLPGSPVTVDAVAAAAGIDPRRALGALASLELEGLARSEDGRYRRAGPGPPAAR